MRITTQDILIHIAHSFFFCSFSRRSFISYRIYLILIFSQTTFADTTPLWLLDHKCMTELPFFCIYQISHRLHTVCLPITPIIYHYTDVVPTTVNKYIAPTIFSTGSAPTTFSTETAPTILSTNIALSMGAIVAIAVASIGTIVLVVGGALVGVMLYHCIDKHSSQLKKTQSTKPERTKPESSSHQQQQADPEYEEMQESPEYEEMQASPDYEEVKAVPAEYEVLATIDEEEIEPRENVYEPVQQ